MSVIDTCIKQHVTVSTAESCTGGLLSAAFTDVAGVSDIFIEGVVTYANEAKIRLGVHAETLATHGAVSPQTASEMANAVRLRAQTTVGLATTGIAGPGGGTPEKPVGLVYIAASTAEKTRVRELRIQGDRATVRRETVKQVLQFLEECI